MHYETHDLEASSLLISSMRIDIRFSALTNFSVQFSIQTISPWPKCFDRRVGTHLLKHASVMWFSNLPTQLNIQPRTLLYTSSLHILVCYQYPRPFLCSSSWKIKYRKREGVSHCYVRPKHQNWRLLDGSESCNGTNEGKLVKEDEHSRSTRRMEVFVAD